MLALRSSVAVAILLFPALASGNDMDRAQTHAAEGERLFDAGKFEQAIVEFEAARKLVPASNPVWNIARSHEEIGDHSAAIAMFEEFLRLEHVSADDQTAAKAKIQALRERRRLWRQITTARALDDAEAERGALVRLLRRSDLGRREKANAVDRLAQLTERVVLPASASSSWDGLGWSLGSAGVVAAGVGTAMFVLRLDTVEQRADAGDAGETARFSRLDNRARNQESWGYGLLLSGGALLAAGASILLFGPDGSQVEVVLGPGSLVVDTRF